MNTNYTITIRTTVLNVCITHKWVHSHPLEYNFPYSHVPLTLHTYNNNSQRMCDNNEVISHLYRSDSNTNANARNPIIAVIRTQVFTTLVNSWICVFGWEVGWFGVKQQIGNLCLTSVYYDWRVDSNPNLNANHSVNTIHANNIWSKSIEIHGKSWKTMMLWSVRWFQLFTWDRIIESVSEYSVEFNSLS